MPANVLLPIHFLYHDRLLEQPLINQLKLFSKDWQSVDSPIRLSIIRMGVILDAPTEPYKLGPKLAGSGERNFRVDFRGAFAGILADYRLLTNNGQKTLYEPEILIFLSSLPISESYWVKSWNYIIDEYHAKAGAYWINQSPLDSNQKKDIDAELSRFLPKVKTLGHSIVEPPISKNLETFFYQKLPIMKKRIDARLLKIKDQQNHALPKQNVQVSVNSVLGERTPSETIKPLSPIEQRPTSIPHEISSIQMVDTTVPDKSTKGHINSDAGVAIPIPGLRNGAPNNDSAVEIIKPSLESIQSGPGDMTAYEQDNKQNKLIISSVENKQPDNGQSNEIPEVKPEQIDPVKASHPAEWGYKEPPPELEDRFPHTYKDSRQGPRNWQSVGASRRGKMHENEGTFREDAFKIEVAGNWILIAVADGAGSHYLSRVGSNLAVTTAILEMKAIVESEIPSRPTANFALSEALRKAWIALYEASKNRNVEFRDLSTTLLLMMYHPGQNLVGVAQVGDGLIAAQLEDGQIALLGKPESGEYSGQTYFLTNHKAEELASKVETPLAPQPIKMIFVMTDGVSDDLYPPQERLPGLIKPMPSILAAENPENALLELINYKRAGSFDDRTLVVACQPEKIIGTHPARKEPVVDPITASKLDSEKDNPPNIIQTQSDQVKDDRLIEPSTSNNVVNPEES